MGVSPHLKDAQSDAAFRVPVLEVESLWSLRWKTIAAQFGAEQSDTLVNFHSVNFRFASLMRDLRRARVPYVLTSHGHLGIQTCWRWFKKTIYLNLIDRGVRRADGLQILTNTVAKRLKYVLPGYKGKLLIQGNLLPRADDVSTGIGSREDFGIPPDSFVMLFLGRLDVQIKGLDILLQALPHLKDLNAFLIFAGPDWQGGEARLRELAARVDCNSRIRFLGPVYGERKWGLLKLADVFVSPSRREEFSVAVTEAMSAGLPVLTSDAVSLAEDMIESQTALVTGLSPMKIAQGIRKLFFEKNLRETLIANARAWVDSHCNPERAGARFREFYQSILDSRTN